MSLDGFQGVQVSDDRLRASRTASAPDMYPHWVSETIRFGDLDAQGHVNNAVYCTFLESGRNAMVRSPDLGVGVAGATFVLAHIEVTYLCELRWPGSVKIGSAVARIGKRSFTLRQAVFAQDLACCANAIATMVLISTSARQSTPIPPEIAKKLSQWMSRSRNFEKSVNQEEAACPRNQ